MRFFANSLRNKLLIGFMLMAFIPASVIGIFYYLDSSKTLEANVGQTYTVLLAHVLNNVEQQIEQVYQLTNWLYLDRNIVGLMQRSPNGAGQYDQATIDVLEKIENQFRFLPLMEHVNAFFLLGHNGLDLRYGPDSYRVNPELFLTEEWFQQGQAKAGELT